MALGGKERRRGKERKESVRIESWLWIHIPVPLSSLFSELVLRGLHQGSHRSSHFSETEKRAGSGVAGTDTERRQAAGTGERNTAQENKQGAKKKKIRTHKTGESTRRSRTAVSHKETSLCACGGRGKISDADPRLRRRGEIGERTHMRRGKSERGQMKERKGQGQSCSERTG